MRKGIGAGVLGFSAIDLHTLSTEAQQRFDDLVNAFFAYPDTLLLALDVPDVRAAYHAFAIAVYPAAGDDILASRTALSGPIYKQTLSALHRVEQAYADHKGFRLTKDGQALVHQGLTKQRKRDPIDVILEPLESPQFFPIATVTGLQDTLARTGSGGSFEFAMTVSLAIKYERVNLDIDEFIRKLGLDSRSTAERIQYRAMLWECLQLFS